MTPQAIQDRMADNISVDLLSRITIDLARDSSLIVNDILSARQRQLLDTVFQAEINSRWPKVKRVR